MTPHPSFYRLDQTRAGVPLDDRQTEHVAACSSCADHLRAIALTPPLPPWTAGVTLKTRRRWPAPVLWSAAAVAAMVVFLASREQPGVREKTASPAVTVFVKRQDEVFTWAGEPLRPRDRLELHLRGAGFHHVSVAALTGGDPPTVLYQGVLGDRPQLLPLSFRVDDHGSEERLSVILGRRPVPGDSHRRAAIDGDLWRAVLVMNKAATATTSDGGPDR